MRAAPFLVMVLPSLSLVACDEPPMHRGPWRVSAVEGPFRDLRREARGRDEEGFQRVWSQFHAQHAELSMSPISTEEWLRCARLWLRSGWSERAALAVGRARETARDPLQLLEAELLLTQLTRGRPARRSEWMRAIMVALDAGGRAEGLLARFGEAEDDL